MSSTQISFASFAKAQLAPAPITVQAQLELEPSNLFAGAYTPWKGLGSDQCAGDWQGSWFIDWQSAGNLDAPDQIPYGAHRGRDGYHGTLADAYMFRPERTH